MLANWLVGTAHVSTLEVWVIQMIPLREAARRMLARMNVCKIGKHVKLHCNARVK